MPNIDNQETAKKCLLIVFLFLSILLLITAYVIYDNYRALSHQAVIPLDKPSEIFEVKSNTSASTLIQVFRSRHWIRSSHVLSAVIRWRGASHRLQAGIYQVKPGEPLLALLDRILKGDVFIQSFQIIEGTSLFEVQKQLKNAPYLHFNPDDLVSISDNHPSAEGLLLADTYYYKAGSQSLTLLKQAHQHLLNYLEIIWDNRDSDLPYRNSYQLLIAASIIEKEAAIGAERRIIGGIIANRLKKGMPLQMDPTVIYAIHLKTTPTQINALHHQDLMIDSPYNTYLHRGLPPTPIAMVGKESLNAAANPEPSHYLYFYAKGDGTHEFSETYQAQKKAIQQFKPKPNSVPAS